MEYTLNRGDEFSLDGKNIYKVTKPIDMECKRFLAIWIGTYRNRDNGTYQGYVKHGDFRTDNALFSLDDEGQITLIHQATGILHLAKATEEYYNAIFN